MPIIKLATKPPPWSPKQTAITQEALEEFQANRDGRRWRGGCYLNKPSAKYDSFGVILPCEETFHNAIAALDFQEVGPHRISSGKCGAFFPGIVEGDKSHTQLDERVNAINGFVGMRDLLAMSFALDYDRENGDPTRPRTQAGKLRATANPYGKNANASTIAAAEQLAEMLLSAIDHLGCYTVADAVCGVPPSQPDKPFHLPKFLAGRIAASMGVPDLSGEITTPAARPHMRTTAIEDKLAQLDGTMMASEGKFEGMIVLLVDDIYQSGVTINYTAKILIDAGATAILGLCCEKACSNTDNSAV